MELTEKEQEARKRVCLPLDGLADFDALKERVSELSPVVGLFKIGKESYTRFGPKSVEYVHNNGSEVFLDLKFHDIPNTVKGAARAAAELQVYMFNVHASGGLEMMKAAVEGANSISLSNARVPNITAVTVLTSLDKQKLNEELRVPGEVGDQVFHYAQLADQAGLDGIVCSAADLSSVRGNMRDDFMYVTPGIKSSRGAGGSDQKRTFTAAKAIQDGSSILVVGRAITDPRTDEEKGLGVKVTPEMRVQAGYNMLSEMAEYL